MYLFIKESKFIVSSYQLCAKDVSLIDDLIVFFLLIKCFIVHTSYTHLERGKERNRVRERELDRGRERKTERQKEGASDIDRE